MIDLTRRRLLTGTVASTAAAGLSLAPGRQARAAAPLAGTQAPSWYRYKVGSFEVTVVADGVNRFKFPDAIVSNVKREEVNAALVAAHGEPDVFVTPYNPIVVNTGQKLVVIDTGLGEAALNASKGRVGQFLTNLAATGIDPNAVDTVIISHYHGDHVNGLLKADNSLAFPNAEILVPAAEHKFWMDDGEMSRAPARVLRSRPRDGGSNAPQSLRHAGGGKDAGPGLPLSIPLACLRRKEWIGLSRGACGVESHALTGLRTTERDAALGA